MSFLSSPDCDDDAHCDDTSKILGLDDEDDDVGSANRLGSGRSLATGDPLARAGALFLQPPAEDGALLASYSVFVVEPGEGTGHGAVTIAWSAN